MLTINLIDHYDSQFGLLKPHPTMALAPQHNVLEITGKLLLYYSFAKKGFNESPVIHNLIDRYKYIWDTIGFIPRTMGDTDLTEYERKKHAWHYEEELKAWIMIHASHSQLLFLLMGLWFCDQYTFVHDVMNWIVANHWRIRYNMVNGKTVTVENGSFAVPYGNIGLKVQAIAAITSNKPGLMANAMLKTVMLWGGMIGMGDRLNTLLWLYWLQELGVSDNFIGYVGLHIDEIKMWTTDKRKHTNDGDRMRDELNNELVDWIVTKVYSTEVNVCVEGV